MIVLLHAYNQSFSAMQVATMFVARARRRGDEPGGGVAGARWGIRVTSPACASSSPPTACSSAGESGGGHGHPVRGTISPDVGRRQGPDEAGRQDGHEAGHAGGEDSQLFKLVSLLTGWKNSLKGVGYFLGSALL